MEDLQVTKTPGGTLMGVCPECGNRKRLNGFYQNGKEMLAFWCRCGFSRTLGTQKEVDKEIRGEG